MPWGSRVKSAMNPRQGSRGEGLYTRSIARAAVAAQGVLDELEDLADHRAEVVVKDLIDLVGAGFVEQDRALARRARAAGVEAEPLGGVGALADDDQVIADALVGARLERGGDHVGVGRRLQADEVVDDREVGGDAERAVA